MPLIAAAGDQTALVFIELGLVVFGLALLMRLAHRIGISAIPLYLLGGVAFGNGGLVPLNVSEAFVNVGAEIGVIMLLFMLGLEFTPDELRSNLRMGLPAGAADFILNFPPGAIAGLIFGWGPLASILLGGVTYISSSGIIARLLTELGRLNNPESSLVLSILVLEDLAMTVFLPVMAALLIGQDALNGTISVLVALATVAVVLLMAVRFGRTASRLIAHQSDEAVLLSTFGIVLMVAGATQWLHVSAAVGAFLVGVGLSGPLVKQTHRTLGPLRDLFAALFFLFFGLEIDPKTLPPVILPAIALALVTGLTKVLTGWWAARQRDIQSSRGLSTGIVLIARGEFSIVIAGMGTSLEPQLGPLAAAYVLILAVAGPIIARIK